MRKQINPVTQQPEMIFDGTLTNISSEIRTYVNAKQETKEYVLGTVSFINKNGVQVTKSCSIAGALLPSVSVGQSSEFRVTKDAKGQYNINMSVSGRATADDFDM